MMPPKSTTLFFFRYSRIRLIFPLFCSSLLLLPSPPSLLFCSAGGVAANRHRNKNFRQSSSPLSRSILIKNDSGSKIDVYWIHPDTRERGESNFLETGGIVYGSEGALNSYVGHSFEVAELPPSPRTQQCKMGTNMCRKAFFKVNGNQDQLFTVKQDFSVAVEDSKTRAKAKARTALMACKASLSQEDKKNLTPIEQIEKLTKCLEKEIDTALHEQRNEIDYQKDIRKQMGQRLTKYACFDNTMSTTQPIRNETWHYGGAIHQVRTLFETDISSLWLVEDFLSDTQCSELIANANADNNNMVLIPLSARQSSNVVNDAIEKIETLMQAFLGNTIQYIADPMMEVQILEATSTTIASDNINKNTILSEKANLVKANKGDIATLRIFCEVPTAVAAEEGEAAATGGGAGGALHFQKSGLHINPSEHQGTAMIIVYRDPGQPLYEEDPYVEEYYECPVLLLDRQGTTTTYSSNSGNNNGNNNRLVTIVDHFSEGGDTSSSSDGGDDETRHDEL